MKKSNESKKNLTLDDLIKMGKITSKTIDRVNIVKSYIEKKYSLRKQKNDEKNYRFIRFCQRDVLTVSTKGQRDHNSLRQRPTDRLHHQHRENTRRDC